MIEMKQRDEWKPVVKRLAVDGREHLKKAKALLRKKHYEEALLEFQLILENDPKSVSALLGMGLVFFRQERFEEALIQFRQAKALDPLQPKPYMLEGLVLLRQENFEDAESMFKAVLDLDARSHRALLGLAEIALSRKQYDEALAKLREALRYNPQLLTPRILSAKVYTEQGNLEKAIGEIQTVLEIDPSQAKAYFHLARLYARRDEKDKAADALNVAMEKLPEKNASVYLKLGLLAVELKLYEVAEKVFGVLLQLQPSRSMVQIYLVEALIGAGKFDKAESALKQLPLNKQNAGLIHKLLGDIYYQRGQFRIAVEEYRATVLGIPELAQQFSELVDEADDSQDDDWESLAGTYQPSLGNVLSDQTERLREARARRRNRR